MNKKLLASACVIMLTACGKAEPKPVGFTSYPAFEGSYVLMDESDNLYIPVTTATDVICDEQFGLVDGETPVYTIKEHSGDWVIAKIDYDYYVYHMMNGTTESKNFSSSMVNGMELPGDFSEIYMKGIVEYVNRERILAMTEKEAKEFLKGKTEEEVDGLFGTHHYGLSSDKESECGYRGDNGTFLVHLKKDAVDGVTIYPIDETPLTEDESKLSVTCDIFPTEVEDVYCFRFGYSWNRRWNAVILNESALNVMVGDLMQPTDAVIDLNQYMGPYNNSVRLELAKVEKQDLQTLKKAFENYELSFRMESNYISEPDRLASTHIKTEIR